MWNEQEHWHVLTGDEALAQLASSRDGLTEEEAAQRRRVHGANSFARRKGEGPWRMFWRQFNNPIGWLLIAAGFLSVFLQKFTDAAVVFGAVAINALLGFVQEFRACRAIVSLAAMVPESAVVLRDGQPVTVSAADLVPGDIVTLQSGDKVPADLRLLQARNLLIEEAPLTGESLPASKSAEATGTEAALGDRTGMAYSGTMVIHGTSTGVVVATGDRTELGRINAMLRGTEQLQTPLTRQLAKVSSGITVAVVAVVAVLIGFSIWIKEAPLGESLMIAVSLAVAAIPEGLPAVITIALAIGVRRMAARRAVVRLLPAVETLGSTTVICTDKTGTLTRNEITAQVAWAAGQEYRFGGVGYAPVGEIEQNGARLADLPAELRELLLIAMLCNDAALRREGEGWGITGDPTEAALVVAGEKAGLVAHDIRRLFPRLDVIPFESDSKFMATLNRMSGAVRILLKGAPEIILERCLLTPAEQNRASAVMETYARQGLRVIACAWRLHETAEPLRAEDVSCGLTLAGFIGMIDPPRTEAVDAVRVCHEAGITVKMITGDHPVTAEAVGRQLGLLHPGQTALRGRELDGLADDEFRAAIRATNVIARVAPEHKLRIVQALQAQQEVVAMTGDGVNDAPALKRADIGVAMGITGTAVAKEAAKVILVDDNFASIAAAVEEGRRVYDNLIKSLAFILPTNLGLACTLSAGMFFFPTVLVEGGNELLMVMSPTQTLWINLVASVTLSIPLAFEVLEPNGMRRRPRPLDEPVFSGFLVARIVLVAVLMAAGTCGLFLWEYYRIAASGPLTAARHALAMAEAQTISVTCITFTQVFYLLNCRSLRDSLFTQGFFANPAVFIGIAGLLLLQACYIYLPPLHSLFGSVPIDGFGWLNALLVGAVVLPVILCEKWLRSRSSGRVRPGKGGNGGE